MLCYISGKLPTTTIYELACLLIIFWYKFLLSDANLILCIYWYWILLVKNVSKFNNNSSNLTCMKKMQEDCLWLILVMLLGNHIKNRQFSIENFQKVFTFFFIDVLFVLLDKRATLFMVLLNTWWLEFRILIT